MQEPLGPLPVHHRRRTALGVPPNARLVRLARLSLVCFVLDMEVLAADLVLDGLDLLGDALCLRRNMRNIVISPAGSAISVRNGVKLSGL